MGCNVGRTQPVEPQIKKQLSRNNTRKNSILEKSREVKQLSEFRMTYSDFVGEKQGKIYHEYHLMTPPIGKGSFGEVRRGVHKKTNINRAVKIIYKSSTDKQEAEQLFNEVNILKNLDHPHIMKIVEIYQDEKQFYIVSEFYTGGELLDKIAKLKTFTEQQAAKIIRQILSAINYCHSNNIVHRDLKPENILFESKKEDSLLKVIDFGTSRFYDPNIKMNQKFGTPLYIAPEVLKKKYTEKCDLWSCGVILYVLLCGHPPFEGKDDKEILEKVKIAKYDLSGSEWQKVSEEAKNFLKKLMEKDPNLRYSAEEALNDPWVTNNIGAKEFDKPLAMTALDNLKKFRAGRKMQEATWLFLVSYLASREEKQMLLKTFEALDLNHDGQLSRDELIEGYQKIMGINQAEKEVDAIMEAVDNNYSGTIDYTEFVMATINRKKILTKERIEATFKLFDKDGNGYLTQDEIKEMFNPGNQREIDDKIWADLIDEVDLNGDGKISFKEFKEMMIKLLEPDDADQIQAQYAQQTNYTSQKSRSSETQTKFEEDKQNTLE